MSNAFQMGQILHEAEAAHGENVNTYTTMQWPIIGAVDVSGLVQAKIDSMRTMAYRNAGTPYLLGVQGGSFKTKMYLPGHGSTTAGATTIGLLETLLGIVLGLVAVSAASGTTFAAGSTVTALNTVASATFAAGSLFKGGTLGDARVNAQWGVVASHVGTVLTSLVAVPVVPIATDVLYSAVNLYTPENPTTSAITTIRAQLLTANLVYNTHGVYPKSFTISGSNFQEFLTIEIEWGVSWFSEAGGVTFPSTVATERFNGAPNVGGSVFVNDVGTATRSTRNARNFSITYKLGIIEQPGPGGVNAYQSTVACRRKPDEIMVSWTEDAPAQTATPTPVTDSTATTPKHVLVTFTTPIGSSVAMYMPNVVITERPVQLVENGINSLRFTGRAFTGPTNTTDLTGSAFRIGLA